MNHEIRRATTWPLLRACTGAGLTLGAAWGLVQALALGLAHGSNVGIKEWAAALGGSAMAHAGVWAVHGLGLGLLGALCAAFDRRVARRLAPGPFAAAVFAAGAGTLLLWSVAAAAGMRVAQGLGAGACLLAACSWATLFAATYGLAQRTAPLRIGRRSRTILRRTAVPLALLAAVWFAGRLTVRPDPVEAPGSWRQEWAAARKDRAPDRPSVVLIVLGTVRADHLGCYGYARPTSPHLDNLATDALVFDRCLTTATATLPARASIVSGLHPAEHETGGSNPWLDGRFATVAELLGERGYETVAFHNGSGATEGAALLQGFTRIFRPRLFQHARSNSIGTFIDRVLYPSGLIGPRADALVGEDSGAGLTNRLVRRWLDGRNRGQPFFLYVEYAEAQTPRRPDLAHRRTFVAPADLERSYRVGPEMPRDPALAGDLYDGAIRAVDDRLGELLAILSPRVALDDAIVVVTSDRGENLGDHPGLGPDRGVYDTLARVPLIVRDVRRARPARSGDVVQTVDILPTVLDAVGGGPAGSPATFGRSLLPLPGSLTRSPGPIVPDLPGGVRTVELTGRVAVTAGTAGDGAPASGTAYAIRQGPWKYIRGAAGPSGAADRDELYRIADDPGERVNLIDQRRDVADALAATLERWLASTRADGATR